MTRGGLFFNKHPYAVLKTLSIYFDLNLNLDKVQNGIMMDNQIRNLMLSDLTNVVNNKHVYAFAENNCLSNGTLCQISKDYIVGEQCVVTNGVVFCTSMAATRRSVPPLIINAFGK